MSDKTTNIIVVLALIVVLLVEVHQRYYMSSSPSSEVGVDSSAPAFIMFSTMELQRELNLRGYKLKVDGVCGRKTQSAWDIECGNQYAIELSEGK